MLRHPPCIRILIIYIVHSSVVNIHRCWILLERYSGSMEQELEDVRLHLQGVAPGPFCQPPHRMYSRTFSIGYFSGIINGWIICDQDKLSVQPFTHLVYGFLSFFFDVGYLSFIDHWSLYGICRNQATGNCVARRCDLFGHLSHTPNANFLLPVRHMYPLGWPRSLDHLPQEPSRLQGNPPPPNAGTNHAKGRIRAAPSQVNTKKNRWDLPISNKSNNQSFPMFLFVSPKQ